MPETFSLPGGVSPRPLTRLHSKGIYPLNANASQHSPFLQAHITPFPGDHMVHQLNP